MQLASSPTTLWHKLGQVIYWTAIIAGILIAPFIGWAASPMGLMAILLFGAGAFGGFYMIGLCARQILTGL